MRYFVAAEPTEGYMPTHEEQLRREQELFEKREELREHSSARPETVVHEQGQRLIEENHRVEGSQLLDSLKGEAFGPTQLAELPRQSEPTKQAVEQLFHHLVERKDLPPEDAEEENQRTTTQIDRKTGLRSIEPQHREPDDLFATGIEGDFVPNTKIAAANVDVHPAPDDGIDWGSGTPRRRRRDSAAPTPFAKKKPPGDGK
ncbi:MAG: hypothetical protein JNM83_01265 [Myxococcales bacterium]|nr:hypothetical protein [Myxococcales bacterium]